MKEKIANNIKGVRVSLGLKQREMAQLCEMNAFSYANYELGRAMPPTDKYLRIMAMKGKKIKRVIASVTIEKEVVEVAGEEPL